ncbi:MAG: hypothetical protein HFH49_17205 [Lachnospiraceae bacterium]|nr:hypothetical protein [Lachnospiraceae bacterium]
MKQRNDVVEIDLKEIVLLLARHIISIAAVTAAGGLAAGLISVYCLTPMYTSTAQIYILTNQGTVVSLSDLQMGSSLANDYQELIRSRPVVEEVAKTLDLDMKYEELLKHLSVTNKENTRIIRINVTYKDPVLAKKLADTFAEVSRKRISEIMDLEEPNIVENAVAAKHQSSPNNRKNAVFGAIAAMAAAAGVIILRYYLDDTVKTADDVEKYLGLNTLAAIPAEGGTDNSEKKQKRWSWGIRSGIRK